MMMMILGSTFHLVVVVIGSGDKTLEFTTYNVGKTSTSTSI